MLTVTNNGVVAATTARVLDLLPSGLSYVSASGTNWACSASGQTVTCDFAESTIAASGGTSTISLVVSTSAGTGGQTLANYASIDPTGGASPPTPGASCSPAGSCASASSTVAAPNLTLAKAQPTPGLREGQQSTYVLTVTNNGTVAATTARVLDLLPSGLSYVSASGTGWSCSASGQTVTCDFAESTIAASGGTSTISLVVSTSAGTGGQTLANYASIDPTGGASPPTPGASCSPAGSCAGASSTVAAPNLTLAKAQPTPGLAVGQQSTYVLTVTNNGVVAATTARVLDLLPSGLSYVSASGTNWSCSASGQTVTCDFSGGTIADSGGTSTISLVVSTSAGTGGQTLANYASIDPTGGASPPAPGASCSPAGSCASASSTVAASDLTIAMAQPTPHLAIGQQSTYVLTVTNGGGAAVTTARVLDLLPRGLSFVSASGAGWSCSASGQTVTCDYSGGTIAAAGGTSMINLVVSTNPDAAGQTLANYASIDPTGGASPPAPGASCTPAAACADVASPISSAKQRTEAIVHNFLARRADRIAGSGLPLDRLITRLAAADPCPDGGSRPTLPPLRLADAAPGTANDRVAEPRLSLDAPPSRPTRRLDSEAAFPSAEPTESSGNDVLHLIGATGSGNNTEGRLAFSGSLAELTKSFGAANQARLDGLHSASCADQLKSQIDLWVDGTFEYFTYDRSEGHSGLGRVGADYQLNPGLLVGVMAQLDNTREMSAELGYLARGTGWMAGPYAAMRLGSNLYLDGRALWGTSSNEVSPYLTYSDSFDTQRFLAAARLSGHWEWEQLAVTPAIEYVHFTDSSRSFVNAMGETIDAQQASISRLIFGPEARYRAPINATWNMESRLSVKGIWDLSSSDLLQLDTGDVENERADFHARADAGVSFVHEQGYSLGISVGVEGIGGDGYQSKSISGMVRVPLN